MRCPEPQAKPVSCSRCTSDHALSTYSLLPQPWNCAVQKSAANRGQECQSNYFILLHIYICRYHVYIIYIDIIYISYISISYVLRAL